MGLKKGDIVCFEAEKAGDPDDGKKVEVLRICKNPPEIGGGIGVKVRFIDSGKERNIPIDQCQSIC